IHFEPVATVDDRGKRRCGVGAGVRVVCKPAIRLTLADSGSIQHPHSRPVRRLEAPAVPWTQNYDPFGHWWLSTIVASLPVIVLLGALAILRIKALSAALLGLATSMVVAVGLFGMPAKMSVLTAIYGAVYGFFPIGWIILNVIFMYDLNCES